ncbi:DUF410-domain-containing protein [Stemphylium lycopersici]|uniref:DUF410-domain-containing protein n=1 Tax=Stemphylium lycopersici TaxID=183478 RepID=A0A364MRS8_STELY|nr:duf410 domain-containing protein [Stemphylium lycopersici]RAQ98750.1 DUF410-domain-containing protein [Stemphylium lycopersici]RAR01123.1 DUF410-domain-containing protein [Stemphylium lycopersici]
MLRAAHSPKVHSPPHHRHASMRLIYGADLEPYHAERHVVLGAKDSPETLANLEYAWCNAEDSQIAPLYTARAMLPFLLAGNLRTPNKFFLFFTTRLSSKAGLRIQQVSTLSSDLRVYLSLQLLNFLGLLLLSVERGNPSLFRQSKSHHAAHLKDANWDEPLDQSNAPTHTGTRPTHIGFHGRKDALLLDRAVKNLLDSDRAGNSDQLGHRGVALGVTVVSEGGGADNLAAVYVLNPELVLEHNEVTLVALVLHSLLKRGAEGVEQVGAGDDLPVK